MKSDPLQGILFKTKPVLLQEKAATRRGHTISDIKPVKFFSKIQTLKAGTKRLTRRKKIAVVNDALKFEYSPLKRKS